jgi:hypothetical protein
MHLVSEGADFPCSVTPTLMRAVVGLHNATLHATSRGNCEGGHRQAMWAMKFISSGGAVEKAPGGQNGPPSLPVMLECPLEYAFALGVGVGGDLAK